MQSNVYFSDVHALTSGKYSKNDDHHFLILNSYCSLDKLHGQLRTKLNSLFVLVINSSTDTDPLTNKNAYIEITHRVFRDVNVQLFKKVREGSHAVVLQVI